MLEILNFEEEVVKDNRHRAALENTRPPTANAAVVPKSRTGTASARGNNFIRYCFAETRDGRCTNDKCKFEHAVSHNDPEGAKLEFVRFRKNHACAQDRRCNANSCFWGDKACAPAVAPVATAAHPTDTATTAKVAVTPSHGFAGCASAFTINKAILDPFRNYSYAPALVNSLPAESVSCKARMSQPSLNPSCITSRDLAATRHDHPAVGMLDSGSSLVMTKNPELLDDVHHTESCRIALSSATDTSAHLDITGSGYLPGPLNNVEANICLNMTANLIGEDQLIAKRGWTAGGSVPGNKTRTYKNNNLNRTVVFVRNYEGMMLCDLEAMKEQGSAFVGPEADPENGVKSAALAYPAVVTKDLPPCVRNMYELGFSHDVISRALLVGVIHERMSYFGYAAIYALIPAHRLPDCRLTSADVRNYFQYLHRRLCVGCMMGKVKSYPQTRRDEPPPDSIGGLLGLDEFFITFKGEKELTIQVLFAKDKLSGFRNCSFPADGTATATTAFVVETDKMYQEYGHKIHNIVMDPSAAHHAAKPMLEALGYRVTFCAVGRHVTWIECDIGILKRALLAQLLGLPYRLGHKYYKHAISYTVDSMNMLFFNNAVRVPMELFVKKELTLEHFLSAKFGQLVITPVETSTRLTASQARGEYGIVVERDFSAPGSWYILRLNPERNMQIISRRELAICENVHPDVRKWIETPGDGISDESCLLTRWRPTDRDEICPETTPITAEVDLSDHAAPAEFVADDNDRVFADDDERSLRSEGDRPLIPPEDRPLSPSEGSTHHEGVSPHQPPTLTDESDDEDDDQPLAEAHLPDTDAFYDDTGAGRSEQEHAEMLSSEMLQEPDDPSNTSPKQKPTPKMNRRLWRAVTGVSKEGKRMYNLRHPKTVRMRLRSQLAALKLTHAQARKEFGDEAADDAVWAELSQLIDKDVWHHVMPDEVKRRVRAGERVMPSSLFLKDKYDAKNMFEKIKARLAVCGNFAANNPDLATESPTASVTALFLALEVGAREHMTKIAADIGGAFLYGLSDQHHLMRLSKNVTAVFIAKKPELLPFVGDDGCIVVELNKTLYGLREASRSFHDLITETLRNNGLTQSRVDKCLFYRTDAEGNRTLVVLYVDDLLIMTTKPEDGAALVASMRKQYDEITVKEGPSVSFLGMEITTDEEWNVKVKQSTFVGKIIDEAGITDTAPTAANAEIMRDHRDDPPTDPSSFYSLTMKLMYAAVRTRPDIIYPVTVLAGRVKAPTVGDRACLDHILRYLNGTREDGLVFRADAVWNVSMSVDASFNHHYDAKGHSGLVIFAATGSAGILIKSLKQKVVANSSCEAELIALHEGILYLLWITSIYVELGYVAPAAIQVGQDNQAAILLSKEDPVNFRGRSKFINRMYFSVYEHVESGVVELVHVGTEDTVSDFMTKSLIGDRFRKFKVVLMGSTGA